jgi:hypothetical protein
MNNLPLKGETFELLPAMSLRGTKQSRTVRINLKDSQLP